MGANISIKEGGKARMFNAARLRTVQPGGGTVDWVPKSDVERSTLYANENGIYSPASDGVYAFDEVRVNVPEKDSFVGTGSDGNKYYYKKKGGGGGGSSDEIEVIELLDHIVVITNPTQMRYEDGETIKMTGISVHAFNSDGEDQGEVPFDELSWTPSVASYSSGQTAYSISMPTIEALGSTAELQYVYTSALYSEYISDGVWGAKTPPQSEADNPDMEYPIWHFTDDSIIYVTEYNGELYAACDPPIKGFGVSFPLPAKSYTLKRDTKYKRFEDTSTIYGEYFLKFAGRSTVDPTGYDINDMTKESGRRQKITIRWPRPGDGAILETDICIFICNVEDGT